MRFTGLVFWMILLYAARLQGAESPRIFHFTKNIYQAHYQNWSITQSSQGVLFFGNTDGLLEYDGSAWALHTLPANQTVRAVAQGKNGVIYTGGYEEFGYWKPDRWGRLHYTSLSATLSGHALKQQEIWHILVSQHGIFFQSFGVLFHYDQKRVRKVSIPNTIMFLQEVNGQVLAPVIEKGLYVLNPDNSWSLLPGGELFAHKTITVLLPDPGGLLVGTQESGFFRYDGQRFVPWEHPINKELTDNQINKAIRLKDGRIAVGTILNGVYILQSGNGAVLHFNRVNSLQNNTVLAMGEDRDGNLWLGLDKGIDMIAFSDPFEYYEDTQGKIGTVYAAALYEGVLYIGGNQGLFYKPYPGNEGFKLVPGTQGQVWQLKVFDGQLLCGHNKGTFLIKNQQARKISEITGGWKLVVWPNTPGILLQGTYTGIVAYKKDETGNWIFAQRVKGLLNPIRNLAPDAAGFLWAVDPYEGIFRLQLSADGLTVRSVDTINTASGLPTDYNLDLFYDGQQTLIWSKDRYYRWNPATKRCTPFLESPSSTDTPQQGKRVNLPNGNQFRIFPQRAAWYRNGQFKSWLPIELVKHNEHIEWMENRYLFCLDNGYAILEQDAVLPAFITTRPIIRSVHALRNGQLLESTPATYDTPGAPFVFPSRTTSIMVHFALPYYKQAPWFRYRIPGWQDEWSPWSSQPFKEFANLPPGLHQLEVESNLAPETTTIDLFIRPHWYQTWWAFLLFLALACGLGFLLYRIHRIRLKLQRRRLLLEKERQLHDQRLQARAEQLQADVLNKSQELANSTFNLIRKNETLLQIKEALDHVKHDLGDRLPDKYHTRLVRLIDSHLDNAQDWQIFETNFTQVHEVFLNRLKMDYPELTPGDLRLAAYLKMNLSSKEIAPLLNISLRGVENKRYRLRQKLRLDNDSNLTEFLMQYT